MKPGSSAAIGVEILAPYSTDRNRWFILAADQTYTSRILQSFPSKSWPVACAPRKCRSLIWQIAMPSLWPTQQNQTRHLGRAPSHSSRRKGFSLKHLGGGCDCHIPPVSLTSIPFGPVTQLTVTVRTISDRRHDTGNCVAQSLLPMAECGSGTKTTEEISEHSDENMFLPVYALLPDASPSYPLLALRRAVVFGPFHARIWPIQGSLLA